MPTHRGIQAFVEVDGKTLEEYGGEEDGESERIFRCFIASEAGKVRVASECSLTHPILIRKNTIIGLHTQYRVST